MNTSASAELYSGANKTKSPVTAGAESAFTLSRKPTEQLEAETADGSVIPQARKELLEALALGERQYLSTGLKELDKAIIGLLPGKNIVIAGRPGMGKTALANSLGRAVRAQGAGVIQFSLEVSKEELGQYELAYQADVNLRKILSGKGLTDEELSRIKDAGRDCNPRLWRINDSAYSADGILRSAKQLSRRFSEQNISVGCVIVDYLQLAGENGDGREQSVAGISRLCKLLAKELGCSVLTLSQLNRKCEEREDKRPLMSDLRDSGSIEQDADIVLYVYREAQYDPSADPEEAELIIRKQRNGPTGTVKVRFIPKHASFCDKA